MALDSTRFTAPPHGAWLALEHKAVAYNIKVLSSPTRTRPSPSSSHSTRSHTVPTLVDDGH